jgi:hypothetical protein
METAKAAHAEFKTKFEAAESGPVKEARDLGADPQDLAKLRDAALDKRKKQIEEAANSGQISVALNLIDDWADEAKGWKDKWESVKDAHAALKVSPLDETKLKALADAPGGGKVFDDLVNGLPDDVNAAVLAAAMKVRFGVELVQYESETADKADLKPVAGNAPDKSVKTLYKMLATVPDTHVKKSLREVVRFTKDKIEGGYKDLKIHLSGSRATNKADEKFETLTKPEHLPEVDEDCRPVDDKNPKQFGWTALHEVGHAIDDAAGFMSKCRGEDKYGGWISSSVEDAAAAAAEKFGYSKDYITEVLNNKGKPLPKKRPPPPPDADPIAWFQAEEDAEEWCSKVVEDYKLWWKGGECAGVAIDGRIYQQAYADQWYSYALAARKQGITGYQFRSPSEWFAELYAAFYSRKLKEVHPAVSWLKELKKV